MSGLITDIRQLRRRPIKAQPVGTIPIEFESKPDNLSDRRAEESHVLNAVSNHIIDVHPTLDTLNTAENGIIESGAVQTEPGQFGPAERVDELTTVLRRMQAMNPNLDALINSLDLVSVELVQAPGNARLWELAGQAMTPGLLYSRQQAIERIRTNTSVSQDRAELGFKLMLESKAIESAIDATTGQPHTDQFYLGGSTPF